MQWGKPKSTNLYLMAVFDKELIKMHSQSAAARSSKDERV
jgi:hypothetical protein